MAWAPQIAKSDAGATRWGIKVNNIGVTTGSTYVGLTNTVGEILSFDLDLPSREKKPSTDNADIIRTYLRGYRTIGQFRFQATYDANNAVHGFNATSGILYSKQNQTGTRTWGIQLPHTGTVVAFIFQGYELDAQVTAQAGEIDILDVTVEIIGNITQAAS